MSDSESAKVGSAHKTESNPYAEHVIARTDSDVEAENGAIMVDAGMEAGGARGLKLAKDGHVRIYIYIITASNARKRPVANEKESYGWNVDSLAATA